VPLRTGTGVDFEASSPWGWFLALAGSAGACVALLASGGPAVSAARQTWSPFVLVAGLVLVGLVAEEDGVFRAAGGCLAGLSRHGLVQFIGAAVMVTVVTATLNLDTSVVFVTPVLIAAARRSGSGEGPLLYGSLLLANASSLFLPGSNLTNLIVLGHGTRSGSAFLATMWPAALAASVVTACAVGVWGRPEFARRESPATSQQRPVLGLGVAAVASATALVIVLPAPALPVLAIGVFASAIRIFQGRLGTRSAADSVGFSVLIGLFGLAVLAGTVGRDWSGPSSALTHSGSIGTAVIAAFSSVVINNLPAASLLAAKHVHHAAALLVGLNLGPNLFASGSLSWFLWLKVARKSGAAPSIVRASRLGLVVVPLSMAAALGALALSGSG